MNRFHWITPFLFTLGSILYMSDRVSTLISPDQSIRLLIILWSVLGLLMYPAYLIARDWEWASLLLTGFVFGFCFTEIFFRIVGSLVLVVLVVWQAYFHLRRIKIRLPQLFHLLNAIAVLFILVGLYLHVETYVRVPWLGYWKAVTDAREDSIELRSAPSNKPDIYYIVLDGYLRSDVLRELYVYDNTEFTDYLQKSGFIIPDQVHSNYAKTAISVASTLNMDYVDSFAPGLEKSQFWWLMEPFIDHSRVRAILESEGYTTVSLSSGWTLTENGTTDVYLHPFPIMLTEFERYVLGDTALRYIQPLIKGFASVPSYDTHRRIALHSFESLLEIPEIAGPKFVFAHLPVPHPPFVFDRDGEHLNPPGNFTLNDGDDFEGSQREYQSGYIGQVEFVNRQMQLVVDGILKKSETPPIILIQSDHGSGLLTDFSSAENTCVRERFSPFAAYYLPGVDSEVIPSDLSAVNLFRLLLNQYFHADLPLLKNEHYYYRPTSFIFRVVDVSSRIGDECRLR